MPHPHPTPDSPRSSGPSEPSITDDKRLIQRQGQQGAGPSQSQEQSRDDPPREKETRDEVEIGEPVPENDRTVRADAEDGKDDLPGADDNGGMTTTDDETVGGSGSERH
jgi:hypothetical protein